MKTFTKSLVFILFFLISIPVFSQLDTEHYFPPLFGREDQGTHYIVLSTHSPIPFDVTITDGSGNLITVLTISNAASTTYLFGTGNTSPLLVTESELNNVMTTKGLHLTGQYPFYAVVRVIAGAQATAITSKGLKASSGKDFRTGHLYQNTGDSYRKSNVFGIIATEDNTTVLIDDIRPGVIFRGTTPSGTPLTSPIVSVTLNAGESYVLAAFVDQAGATENLNGVNGTHITSDKPIVVSTGSWLGSNCLIGGLPSSGRDIGIDEITPIDVIGNEYVLIKGEGIDNEKVIVVAAYDNTEIKLNGNPVPVTTINAGDYYVVDGSLFSALENLYILASKDIYVYQVTNGGDGAVDDNERQNDLSFIPPVGCSGSKNVFLPNVNWVGTAYINIIANIGSHIYINGNYLGNGDAVTGTSGYVTYKLTSGFTGDVNIVSDDLIRVALINLSGNIGAACYFSGFTKDVVVQTQTVNGDNIALEGCKPASFTFSLDSPADENTEISYTIAGTAANGIDYDHIDNSLIIPKGQVSATVMINSSSDGIPEGQESIYIIYQPDGCSPVDTAFLYIDDALPIEFEIIESNLDCYNDNSGEILVNATGGFPEYSFYVTTNGGLGTTSIFTENPITGLDAGQYSVQVYDSYGCKADALVVGGLFDADTTFLPDGSGVSYTTSINISGFGPDESLDDMSKLNQICANMEHSYLGDLQIRVISPTGQSVILKEFYGGGSCDLGEPFASGPIDGQHSYLIDPGIGYEYCWNAEPYYLTMVQESQNFVHTIPASTGGTYTDYYLPQGSYQSYQNIDGLLGSALDGDWTLEISDQYGLDNGYVFNWSISLVSDLPDTLATITQPTETIISGFVSQAQCGTNDGAINISVEGDYPPYTYLWSNDSTTQNISEITAGTYSVYVTNSDNCTDSAQYTLNNISSLNISYTSTSVTCAGGTNGAINISPSGGTPPYSYNWSNGATSEDLFSVSAGNYTITITDSNECIFSKEIVVNTLPSITITENNLLNEICGTANGSIDINVTGGSGSYGYIWNNGSATQDLYSIPAGTYNVTVIDGYNCTASNSFSIINDVSNCSQHCYLDAVVMSINDEICGNENGSIDISITGTTQPYTVLWNTGSTSEDISNLSAGVYTVTINDANQCELIESFTVNNLTSGLGILSNTIVDENCGNNNGSIDITVNGGTLPYNYLWSNGAINQDINLLSAGNYTVTITDGNSCQLTETYNIQNNTGTLNYSAFVTNELCDNNNGNINLTITGANGNVTYLWSNGANNQDISNLNTGSYFCIITDQSGCTLETSPISVTNNTGTLSIQTTEITNENCVNGQGAIELNIIGGTTPYSYVWSSGQITEDLYGLSEGNYSCTITDHNGCSVSTGNLTVWNTGGDLDVNTELVIDELCNNGKGAIYVNTTGGTQPYSFLWNNGSVNEDNINLSAGIYNLIVTDLNGCTVNLSETVYNNSGTLQIDNAVITHENCGNNNGAIDLFVSGGTANYNYEWSNGQIIQDLNSLTEGNYSITVTDANGCQVSDNYTIDNISGTLSVSVIPTAELCSNGEGAIDIFVSGGTEPYTFLWSNSDISEDLTSINGGTYSCIITDNTGCSINTGDITIANNPGTLEVNSSAINETCNNDNGSIDLTVSGGNGIYTYSWSNSATSQDIFNLTADTYSFTVTDENGCTISGSEIIINTSGTLTVFQEIQDELCNDNNGSINLSIQGGSVPYNYLWNNYATTEDLTGLNEGVYFCNITDNSGCSVTTGDIIVSNNSGTLNLSNILVVNENCENGIGSINIDVSGGTIPYTYLWSNSATTEDILSLSAGNYSCTITDATGCSIDLSAIVYNEPGNLQIFSQTITNESCNSDNGAINLTVAGGTPGYNYLWSNGQTTEDISSLNEGTYSLFVSDASGCSFSSDFNIINVGGNMNISNVTINDEICGNAEGAIDITINDGTTPYLFNWSNGAFTEDISGLTAGIYSVVINDINNCSVEGYFTVGSDNGTLVLVSSAVSDEYCGNGLGAINLTITGGSLPISYNWSNGEITQDLYGLSSGTYSVLINDQFGCSISNTETIENITNGFSAILNSTTEENCGNGMGAIDINVSGGTAPYNFLWSNGETTEDITNLTAGNYEVTVTDFTGCSTTLNATVNNNTGTLAISQAIIQNADCLNANGFIDLTVTGGTLPYNFNWSNSAITEDIIGLTPGNYNCLVTDNSGCSLTYYGTVINTGGNINTTALINDDICNSGNGSIEVTVLSGISPYNFSWSEPQDPCCSYTLEMHDSFGDSWNGGYLRVYINGLIIGQFSAFGNETTEFIPVCNGDLIQMLYVAGEWEEENSYSIINSAGTVVFSDGPNPSTGLVFTADASCTNNSPNTSGIDNLSVGTYSLTITDGVGCSLTESYYIQNLESDLQLNLVSTTNDVCLDNQGKIFYNVTGGTSPYTTTLNGQIDTYPYGSFQNLLAGDYELVVVDDIGCNDEMNIVIENSTSFTTTVVSVQDEICNMANGSVDIEISNSGTLEILWSNGAVTEDISGLSAGTYTVSITDTENNCEDVLTFEILNISDFTVDALITDEYCGQSSGTINLTITGSTDISFDWNNGAVTEDLTGLSSGNYICTITNNITGCQTTVNYEIVNITTGVSTDGEINNDYCGGGIGAIDLIVAGGSGNYLYEWSNGSFTEDLNGIQQGSYTVIVTDANDGCQISQTFDVEDEISFEVNAIITDATCSECSNGAIDLTINEFYPDFPYTYLWSNGATTLNIANILPGSYSVTITSNLGCVVNETYEVDYLNSISETTKELDVYPNPTYDILYFPDVSKNAEISIYDITGKLILVPKLSNNQIKVNSLSNGIYIVEIVDNNLFFRKKIVKI